jgi:hypothetical protein
MAQRIKVDSAKHSKRMRASGKRGRDREHTFERPTSYWEATRRPFPSLLLVAPILATYEAAALWLGGDTTSELRTGADLWMRLMLVRLGLTDHWFLPMALVMILAIWQLRSFRDWRFSPAILVGMVIESACWAISLVGISRLIDTGFGYLDRAHSPLTAITVGGSPSAARALVGYLGAGIYEETLFRLIMIPCFFRMLKLLQAPQVMASSLAVTGSALMFALAHHAGAPAETFTWFAFIFRWMAGVFFAWIFVVRGFGIAVGTHAGYDIMVGSLGWQF